MILNGDALENLRTLPDGSARCCVTSPPYWGLRDYGTATWDGGDPECDHMMPEVGANATSGLNAKRNPDGTLADDRKSQVSGRQRYKDICRKCGSRRTDSQIGLERTPEEYVSRLVEVFREVRRVLADDGTLWCNLGDSYAKAGESGLSLHTETSTTGKPNPYAPVRKEIPNGLKPKDLVGIPWRVAFALQADGWYLRSDIIWSKPNPMPESVTDRPTKAHEFVFLLSKRERYYYDAEAIAEPAASEPGRGVIGRGEQGSARAVGCFGRPPQQDHSGWMGGNGISRNRRSVWTITTEPYPEAHFAVMPQALVEPCILAGSEPRDTVLDPFAGAGTVGVVAARHGREFVGIELNADYARMARNRIQGPLFAEAP